MKAFVYEKATNKTVAVYRNVSCVRYEDGVIYIMDETVEHAYDRKKVKTRIYQN